MFCNFTQLVLFWPFKTNNLYVKSQPTCIEVNAELIIHVSLCNRVDEFLGGRTVGLETSNGHVQRNVLRYHDPVLRLSEHGRRLVRDGHRHAHLTAETWISCRTHNKPCQKVNGILRFKLLILVNDASPFYNQIMLTRQLWQYYNKCFYFSEFRTFK